MANHVWSEARRAERHEKKGEKRRRLSRTRWHRRFKEEVLLWLYRNLVVPSCGIFPGPRKGGIGQRHCSSGFVKILSNPAKPHEEGQKYIECSSCSNSATSHMQYLIPGLWRILDNVGSVFINRRIAMVRLAKLLFCPEGSSVEPRQHSVFPENASLVSRMSCVRCLNS